MTGLHWICWFCWGAGHIYEFPNPWVLNVFPCVYVFSFIKVLHFSVYVSSSSLVVYSKVSYSFWVPRLTLMDLQTHFGLTNLHLGWNSLVCRGLTAVRNTIRGSAFPYLPAVVQSLSHVQLCVTPWTAACQVYLLVSLLVLVCYLVYLLVFLSIY